MTGMAPGQERGTDCGGEERRRKLRRYFQWGGHSLSFGWSVFADWRDERARATASAAGGQWGEKKKEREEKDEKNRHEFTFTRFTFLCMSLHSLVLHSSL